MARIVEDSGSEAEFPDLKDLLKGAKGRGATVLPANAAPGARRGGTGRAREAGKRTGSREGSENGSAKWDALDGVQEEKGSLKAGERSVMKKRVLGRRDDNPLLRPLVRSAREKHVKGTSSKLSNSIRESASNAGTGRGEKVSGEVAIEEATDPEAGLGERMGKVKTLKQRVRRGAAQNLLLDLELEKEESPDEMPDSAVRKLGSSGDSKEVEDQTTKLKERPGVNARNTGLCSSQTRFSDTVEDSGEPSELESLNLREAGPSMMPLATSKDSRARAPRPTKPVQESTTTKSKREQAIITIDSENEDPITEKKLEDSPELQPPKYRRLEPPPRTKSKYILTDTEEEDSPEDDDSDGMSDFIVSDHESIEGDSSLMEIPPPPPRSVRKLVKGRRRRASESEDEDLDLKMGRLRVDYDDIFGDFRKSTRDDGVEKAPVKPPTKSFRKPQQKEEPLRLPPKKENSNLRPSSDVEDPFTLRFSPSENKRKPSKETRFTTPPSSPKLKPRTLLSPTKLPRIPNSPHRQSSDAFWAPDVVNDWNDEYSPRKAPKPTLKPLNLSPIKAPRLTKETKKAFSQIKHELASSFLAELDEKITNGKIAEMAAGTGGVKIIWSKRLNTTAGRANWKRETLRPQPSASSLSSSTSGTAAPAPLTYRHHAAIELAEKVIDDSDRLLNVIAHEFCHLANFMVSNIRINPHGKDFKAWAAKVSREFGDRGIEVTTKHSYEIEYKYVWECENCGTEFKRHSKSIDVAKHRCGLCKYKLVQTKPVPRKGEGEGKGVNGYQQFVKEHMKAVREENPGSPQKEIMGLVGKRYQEYKASRFKEETVSVKEVGSKEGTPVDEVGEVLRKLDFLDLTSP